MTETVWPAEPEIFTVSLFRISLLTPGANNKMGEYPCSHLTVET